jgi:hypothetical protein
VGQERTGAGTIQEQNTRTPVLISLYTTPVSILSGPVFEPPLNALNRRKWHGFVV